MTAISDARIANTPEDIPRESRRRRDHLALVLFVVVFVLCNSVIAYLGARYHFGLFLIGAPGALLLTGYVACLVIFRSVTLRLFRSPMLLVAAAILASQIFVYRAAFHLIDLVRLHANMPFYTAAVEASRTSPRFVTFSWGESGFAGSSGWYYLLFDETGHSTNPPPGTLSTALAMAPGPNCSASVKHLTGKFYSLAIHC